MIKHIVLFFLAIQAGIVCAEITNVQTHTLAPNLANSAFGTYQLPLVWMGTQAITYQTGYYKYGGVGAMSVTEEDSLRFDRFSNQSKMWMARQMLDDSTVPYTNFLKKVYGYVPLLPSDSDMIQVHDDSTFTNLFNLNQNTFTSKSFPRQTFHFYTLGSNNTIKVMELIVEEKNGNSKTNIQVVLIKRGVLNPRKP